MTSPAPLRRLLIALTAATFLLGGVLNGVPAQARTATLTNTAHLDFLLDQVTVPEITGHTTYRLADEPTVTMPWTYADAGDGGTFQRVGGGKLDPATGDWGQGAFNADDISRAAVVYLRHWRQFGDTDSRDKAYELLRGLAYLQTATGPNRGNVVLWMTDGTLNPSAEPVEQPIRRTPVRATGPPARSGRSARGMPPSRTATPTSPRSCRTGSTCRSARYSARSSPTTATTGSANGRRVPAWLIINGADATAEAAFGLSAYVQAAPGDVNTRRVLRQLLEGVAEMGTERSGWPYGAILPWAESRAMWTPVVTDERRSRARLGGP